MNRDESNIHEITGMKPEKAVEKATGSVDAG